MEDSAKTVPGRVFVGGLGQQSTDESLKAYFSQFGAVEEAAVVIDKLTGTSRGFGFCTFESSDSVVACLNQRHKIDGVSCEVRKALPKELSSENAPYDTVEQPSKVFIGGLKEDITEEQLRSYFTKFGAIRESTLMYDKTNHRPRGFGFVTFESVDDARKSIGHHPNLCIGCEVKAAFAKDKSSKFLHYQQYFRDGRGRGFMEGPGGAADAGRFSWLHPSDRSAAFMGARRGWFPGEGPYGERPPYGDAAAGGGAGGYHHSRGPLYNGYYQEGLMGYDGYGDPNFNGPSSNGFYVPYRSHRPSAAAHPYNSPAAAAAGGYSYYGGLNGGAASAKAQMAGAAASPASAANSPAASAAGSAAAGGATGSSDPYGVAARGGAAHHSHAHAHQAAAAAAGAYGHMQHMMDEQSAASMYYDPYSSGYQRSPYTSAASVAANQAQPGRMPLAAKSHHSLGFAGGVSY